MTVLSALKWPDTDKYNRLFTFNGNVQNSFSEKWPFFFNEKDHLRVEKCEQCGRSFLSFGTENFSKFLVSWKQVVWPRKTFPLSLSIWHKLRPRELRDISTQNSCTASYSLIFSVLICLSVNISILKVSKSKNFIYRIQFSWSVEILNVLSLYFCQLNNSSFLYSFIFYYLLLFFLDL